MTVPISYFIRFTCYLNLALKPSLQGILPRMFKRKKVIATYSKSHPVQITKGKLFLTPDTPEDSWIPYSKGKSLKQGTKGKGKYGIYNLQVCGDRTR